MSTYDNLFSNFGRSPVPDDLCTDLAPRHPQFWRRRFFKGSYHIWAWWPSWSTDRDHFSNLSFHWLKKAQYEIWANLAQWLQRRRNLKFSKFSYSNVWGSYKCIGKQTWPCRKKVKCQRTIILLAILVDLSFPMICAKIQPQGILGSGEENF